jgi:hypothetical protein
VLVSSIRKREKSPRFPLWKRGREGDFSYSPVSQITFINSPAAKRRDTNADWSHKQVSFQTDSRPENMTALKT